MPSHQISQFERSSRRDGSRGQLQLELLATRGRSTWRTPKPKRARRQLVTLLSRA